ncbi:hypothetical protein [Bartonella sp. AP36NXGY]|uniref:hypothetical protein n=1 Tax=Bartonella sp. AP36NXGY TaxID=3243493 RepID=UPI0035D09613
MRFRGKGSSSTDRFQPIKRHVQGGKELVFVLEEVQAKSAKSAGSTKSLVMNVKAWWENGERKGAWSACKAARYAGGENENGE